MKINEGLHSKNNPNYKSFYFVGTGEKCQRILKIIFIIL